VRRRCPRFDLSFSPSSRLAITEADPPTQTSAVAASTFPFAVLVIAILLATVVGITPATIYPIRMNLSMGVFWTERMMVMITNTTVGNTMREMICVKKCR